MTPDEKLALLDKHSAQLGEHFDCVQIFVSRFDSQEGTENISYGSGNWFARRGQVQDWLVKVTEETKINVRNRDDNE